MSQSADFIRLYRIDTHRVPFWTPNKKTTKNTEELLEKLGENIEKLARLEGSASFLSASYELENRRTSLNEWDDAKYMYLLEDVCIAQWHYQVVKKNGFFKYVGYDAQKIILLDSNENIVFSSDRTIVSDDEETPLQYLTRRQTQRILDTAKDNIRWDNEIAPYQALKIRFNNNPQNFEMDVIVNDEPIYTGENLLFTPKKVERQTDAPLTTKIKSIFNSQHLDFDKHASINDKLSEHITTQLDLLKNDVDKTDPTYRYWIPFDTGDFLSQWKQRIENLCLLDILYARPEIGRWLINKKEPLNGVAIKFDGTTREINLSAIKISVNHLRNYVGTPRVKLLTSEYDLAQDTKIATFTDHTNLTAIQQTQVDMLRAMCLDAKYITPNNNTTQLGNNVLTYVAGINTLEIIKDMFKAFAKSITPQALFEKISFRQARHLCTMLQALCKLHDKKIVSRNAITYNYNQIWDNAISTNLNTTARIYVVRINEAEKTQQWVIMTALCEGLYALYTEIKLVQERWTTIKEYKETMESGVPYVDKKKSGWEIVPIKESTDTHIIDKFPHSVIQKIRTYTSEEINSITNLDEAYLQWQLCLFELMRNIAEQILGNAKINKTEILNSAIQAELEWYTSPETTYKTWDFMQVVSYMTTLHNWCNALNVSKGITPAVASSAAASNDQAGMSTDRPTQIKRGPGDIMQNQVTKKSRQMTFSDNTTKTVSAAAPREVSPQFYELKTLCENNGKTHMETLRQLESEYGKMWNTNNENPWTNLISVLTGNSTQDIKNIKTKCNYDLNRRVLRLYTKSIPEEVNDELTRIFGNLSTDKEKVINRIQKKSGAKGFMDKMKEIYIAIQAAAIERTGTDKQADAIKRWREQIDDDINKKPWQPTPDQFLGYLTKLGDIVNNPAS